MGLSDEQKRKVKPGQQPTEKLSPQRREKMKSIAKSKTTGRPVMSEEQKQKARELAKKKFEEKQKIEREKAEQEKAEREKVDSQDDWSAYSLDDNKPKKSKTDSEMGKRGLTQKQKNMAIHVEKDRAKAEALYEKAVGKYMRPDLDEALLLMRSALSLHPSNPKYHYNIAYVYSVRGDDEIALNHYRSFLRYAPANDPDIENVKARVIYYEKKIREAFELNRQNKDKLF